MRYLLVIVGQPGAGKTTILRRALLGVPAMRVTDSRPPVTLYPAGVQLGVDRPGGFAGSDAYPMNVQPQAVAFLRDAPFRYIVTEGDRLSNDGIFQSALDFGYDLEIAWLDTPDDIASARRTIRGSNQSTSWILGRQTKVLRLVARWNTHVRVIDGSRSPDQCAAELARTVVIAALRNDASDQKKQAKNHTET